jgi:hypothetical protein
MSTKKITAEVLEAFFYCKSKVDLFELGRQGSMVFLTRAMSE